MCTRFWWGNLRERDNWGDPDVNARIILNGWLSEKCAVFGWETWGKETIGVPQT
jgi:hypothetical protein